MSESATLTSATTLLQHPHAREGVRRGRLLPWQERQLREYIDTHIPDQIAVADLRALVRLCEAHFARSFRLTFGMSARAYLIRRRLELAAQHMLRTKAPLRDIALQCGFTDQAHFGNRFLEATGFTPGAWRRSYCTQGSQPPTTDVASALER